MFISEIFFKSLSELNENKQSQAHEYNLDAAQREMDRREAEGEDMSGARINPKTYEIIKPKKNVGESQLNEYLVKAGMPVSDVLALNVFQDTSPDGQEGMDHDPQWQQLMSKYAPIANMLKKKILALGRRRLSRAEANAIEGTWYDGSDAYDDMEVEYLADYYDQQIDIIEALLAGNITDEEFGESYDNEQSSRDAVMSSIIRRITMQHLDALGKYGPQAIMDAAEETADWVGDVDEIGSSDVSIWTRQTLERLGHK